ncbi:MAG: polyprenyl synthetase family protein [Caldimicrobium sp.]
MATNILSYLKEEISQIDKALADEQIAQHPFINQVSEYVIFAGGKRIRPLLCVLSGKAVNPALSKEIYRTSLLFEYLHAATLLHDDVVDSAEFRRGRKAARKLWGNQATILVGDYLFAKAFKMASHLKNLEIMDTLTETTLLLSEGEVLQLLHLDDTELSEEKYYEIIFRKTAVLMACSCKVGALLGGAPVNLAEKFFHYGHFLGMSFQIVDDLLDYLGTETGKDRGKDFKEGKITLPVILALQSATPEEKDELLYLLKAKKVGKKDFERAFSLIEKNQGFLKSLEKAKDFINKAKEFLREVPSSTSKEALLFICDYLLERKK